MPIRAARTTADRLTTSDNRTIANSAVSPFRTSCQALKWSDILPPPTLFGKNSDSCQSVGQAQKYAYKCRMEFLTTSEAADYLRLGQRTLYDLATVGACPC